MKFPILFVTVLLAIFANVVNAADDHDHESCACAAEETGFTINCEDQDAMTTALAMLQSNNCTGDCSTDVCAKNYFIIQTHHDYCLEDQVPPAVEEGLHDYEDACEDCEISSLANPNFPECPQPNCKVDGGGNAAYQALMDNGCIADCSSDVCRDNFRILTAAHDTCPEDSLSAEAEEGLHDLEEPCEAQGCNVIPVDGSDPLVCEETAVTSGALMTAGLGRSPFLLKAAGGIAALMVAGFF
jgi:hypothetical protein